MTYPPILTMRPSAQHDRLKALVQKAILALLISLAGLNAAEAYAGSHPSKMDLHLRDVLCTNQMAMCDASCLQNTQHNSCVVDTLESNCACANGVNKRYKDWEFPIPFKLCRMDLLLCLKKCPVAESNHGDSELPAQQFQLQLTEQSINDESEYGDDFDQDDYDAIEQIQQLQQTSKLEDDTYSRFEKEGHIQFMINSKSKLLQKKLWAKQRDEIGEGAGNDGDMKARPGQSGTNDDNLLKNSIAPTTITDPTKRHDAECARHCQSEYSCGTDKAPEYNGITQIPRS
ncbi:hypothetical protein EDD11_007262 [Mortierella claussenii]|nr:hypothetical protein EDD11_007262 [Mortierella claussenii]